jgi:hypothetical protein
VNETDDQLKDLQALFRVPVHFAGTDFIVARNGRIASVYLFFDNLA